jgi:SEL1 protein
MAVSFHKLVAERGVWGDDLLRDADMAWSSGTIRGKEMAMLKWWIAAERGSEIAQNNLAFVLDQGTWFALCCRCSCLTAFPIRQKHLAVDSLLAHYSFQ